MPEPVAIHVCSGQGGQHSAVFDLVASCPEAELVFAASAVLGQDPRRFVRGAAPADLFSDLFGQILCCTQAPAAWAALDAGRPVREQKSRNALSCSCRRRSDVHPRRRLPQTAPPRPGHS
jgi:[acyl-carrier-protein] S-malonyltransferase